MAKILQRSEKAVLQEALKDLEGEFRFLRLSRKKLENNLEKVSQQLNQMKEKEIKLRTEISNLMAKEMLLDKKKIETRDKIVALNSKIEKVKSLSRELREV